MIAEHRIPVSLSVAELDVLRGLTYGLGESADPMDRRGADLYDRFCAADRTLDERIATGATDETDTPRVYIAGPEHAGHGQLRAFATPRDAAIYAAQTDGYWLGREILTDATPENTATAR